MSAPRKFDQEFRERAIRLYRERLQQHDESKLGARRHVGVLLDVNPATLRNWVEDAERADGVRAPARLVADPGYRAVQTIPGIGPVLAAVFVAEIGDVHRFPGPAQLTSWAGQTPKHHESDTTVHRGRITKQGSRLVRWAAVEAVQRVPRHTRLGPIRGGGG